MMKALLNVCILVVVLTTVCSSPMYHDLVIQVSEYKGSDNKTCLTGPNSYCKSLEFVASNQQYYSHNIITIVLDSHVHLQNQVIFNNSEFLTIIGRRKSNKVICNCKKDGYGGISFFNVHHLLLSNTGITKCCGTSNMYRATVLLYKCSDITIEYVSVYGNTNGSAMVLVNPHGEVNIKSCTFIRNGHNQRLASNTSFAGGIHLQFSEQIHTNITVCNCEFRDNRAPRYDATSLGSPTDWNGNSIGGGMCIALLESTSGSYKDSYDKLYFS